MTTDTKRIYHKWEDSVGQAPYSFVNVISLPAPSLAEANPQAYQNAMQEAQGQARYYGVGLGSCDVCGMCLMNNFVLRNAEGKHFVVGCDCVSRSGQTKLMEEVEIAEKKRRKAQAFANKRAAWEKEQQRERDANGGKTRHEIRAELLAEQEAEWAELRSRFEAESRWVIEILETKNGGFAYSIASNLRRGDGLHAMSERASDIVTDMVCKAAGIGKKGIAREEAVGQAGKKFRQMQQSHEEAAGELVKKHNARRNTEEWQKAFR